MKGRIDVQRSAPIFFYLLLMATLFPTDATALMRSISDKPSVQVTKTDQTEGAVLSERIDDRTKVSVVVRGGTPREQAVAWLDEAIKVGQPQMAGFIENNRVRGLVAASFWYGDARVTVSWGPPPLGPGARAQMVSQYRDDRTKLAILVRGDTSAQMAEAWLAAAIAADGEPGIAALVAAKHTEGLIGVTSGGLTTWWEPRTR